MNLCEQYGELISAAIDDELSADERSRLEKHLAECVECRGQFQCFEQVDRLFHRLVLLG